MQTVGKNRRSSRLPHYSYVQPGGYFLTLCTHERRGLFGEIIDGQMRRNGLGQIVEEEWLKSSLIRAEIQLDEYVAMPNHFHAIVLITAKEQQAHGRAPLQREPRSISSLVAGYKSAVTKRINSVRNTPGAPVWQRNYHEHVIRNEIDLLEIRQYIRNNPLQWALDRENPDNSRAHGRAPLR